MENLLVRTIISRVIYFVSLLVALACSRISWNELTLLNDINLIIIYQIKRKVISQKRKIR